MNEQTNIKFQIGSIYGHTSGTGIGYDCFEWVNYIKVHKRTDKTIWISKCRVDTIVCGIPCGPTPIDYIIDALSIGEIVRRKIYVNSDGVEYIKVDNHWIKADDLYE